MVSIHNITFAFVLNYIDRPIVIKAICLHSASNVFYPFRRTLSFNRMNPPEAIWVNVSDNIR
ncbi:hypothetical protein BI292_27590 [Pseudomonas sp. 43NM1]|nr:hypothetical protein BI292_27590 [Pseudomonas sp. 43NM1]